MSNHVINTFRVLEKNIMFRTNHNLVCKQIIAKAHNLEKGTKSAINLIFSALCIGNFLAGFSQRKPA